MQVAKPKKGYKLVKTSFGKYEEIPEEWEYDDFKKLVFFQEGPGLRHWQFGTSGIPFLNIRTITNKGIDKSKCQFVKQEEFEGRYEHFLLDENDIVMSSSGTLGKTTTIKKSDLPLMLNTSTIRLRPNDEKLLDRKFLQYFLHTKMFKKQIMLMNTGTAILNFGPSHLNQMKIICPKLKEQQKIASILSNVDDTLQKTNQIIEQTQRLKNGMMQKLLTRGIGHTKFKKTKIGEIPETWDLVRVEDIIKTKGDVRTGPFGSHLLNHELVDRGIRVIYPEDIVNHTISDSVKKCITSEKYQKLKRYSVKSRDVVISLMGTIGQIGLVNEDVGKAIISKHILKISLDPKKFYPEFFCRLFDFTPINNQLHALSQGQIMKGLNTKIIKEIKLPAPKLNEQKQIASILSNVDTQIQKEKLHKSNLERLKKGLMQKLLTGQIRVKV